MTPPASAQEQADARVGVGAQSGHAGAPAMEVVGLTKVFQQRGFRQRKTNPVVAVDRVSFTLKRGTTLGIVGESGSGKTTVARMIVGLEIPTAGQISVFGQPRPARLKPKDMRSLSRQVQMVFQNPYRSLDPRQPVGKALDEMLRVHFDWDGATRAARASELLALVRLEDSILSALPKQLSGGQRQRVCIARALAAEPRIIILDEAVSSLDVSIQGQVLNVLSDVRDETGVSYLFVTHDLAVVRQIADEVVVMQSGKVVERGTATQILDAPQEQYTRHLLEAVPREGWKPWGWNDA
jgi:oligopeptide transport system ATP-binding protein